MKKILIIIAALIAVFALLIILMGITKGEVKEITFNEYRDMIENKESFIFYIGSSKCSHCADYNRTLQRVIKNYEVTINYLDITTLTEAQTSNLESKIRFKGTPTTAFIVDGEEKSTYNRIEGAKSYDFIIDKFKENGYIKGGK